MKKILAMLLAVVMVVGLCACGSSNNAPAASQAPAANNDAPAANETPAETDAAPVEPAAPVTDMKVAMITDYGDITDQSFNQTTYEACKAFADANGLTFNYYKPSGDSTAERVAMVDAAVADGYNVLVMPGYAFGATIVETAELYPDVKFVGLDVSTGDLGDGYTILDNTFCAVYQEELCGYMAGYASVKLGYTKLAFCGGMAVPAVVRYNYGFAQGADAAAVELGIADQVTYDIYYANQFYGDADITAAMDACYANGAELVFACGGGVFTSVGEAAAKVGGKVVGVDVDQAATINGLYGEGMTVTSAAKGLGATVQAVLTDIMNGNWDVYSGKCSTLGLVSEVPSENYVEIPMGSTQWSDAFTQDDYVAMVKAMFNGEIVVSNDITATPAATIAIVDHGNIK